MENATARAANLLGAYARRAADLMDAAGAQDSDRAALLALDAFAEGHKLDVLRRALALSQPGAAHLAGRLERAGLVERVRHDGDRRELRALLTPAGRRAAAELRAARAAALSADLAVLSAREQDALADLLAKLLAGAAATREDARRICRLCDPDACGHPERCPVTRAVHGVTRANEQYQRRARRRAPPRE